MAFQIDYISGLIDTRNFKVSENSSSAEVAVKAFFGTNNMCLLCRLEQCLQLAKISAAKHESGRIKILAAGKICARIFVRFFKKWPNFLKCVIYIKSFIIGRTRLFIVFNALLNLFFKLF
jgi:hypothetical protein